MIGGSWSIWLTTFKQQRICHWYWMPITLVWWNGLCNMWGHTGWALTLGWGFPIVNSTKQKLNTHSSMESELVGVDDLMPTIRAQYFLKLQGYDVTYKMIYQDNQSTILMKRNVAYYCLLLLHHKSGSDGRILYWVVHNWGHGCRLNDQAMVAPLQNSEVWSGCSVNKGHGQEQQGDKVWLWQRVMGLPIHHMSVLGDIVQMGLDKLPFLIPFICGWFLSGCSMTEVGDHLIRGSDASCHL